MIWSNTGVLSHRYQKHSLDRDIPSNATPQTDVTSVLMSLRTIYLIICRFVS